MLIPLLLSALSPSWHPIAAQYEVLNGKRFWMISGIQSDSPDQQKLVRVLRRNGIYAYVGNGDLGVSTVFVLDALWREATEILKKTYIRGLENLDAPPGGGVSARQPTAEELRFRTPLEESPDDTQERIVENAPAYLGSLANGCDSWVKAIYHHRDPKGPYDHLTLVFKRVFMDKVEATASFDVGGGWSVANTFSTEFYTGGLRRQVFISTETDEKQIKSMLLDFDGNEVKVLYRSADPVGFVRAVPTMDGYDHWVISEYRIFQTLNKDGHTVENHIRTKTVPIPRS